MTSFGSRPRREGLRDARRGASPRPGAGFGVLIALGVVALSVAIITASFFLGVQHGVASVEVPSPEVARDARASERAVQVQQLAARREACDVAFRVQLGAPEEGAE